MHRLPDQTQLTPTLPPLPTAYPSRATTLTSNLKSSLSLSMLARRRSAHGAALSLNQRLKRTARNVPLSLHWTISMLFSALRRPHVVVRV